MSEFSSVVLSWPLARELAMPIRREVFIEEQQVPEELEWDEYDARGFHVLVIDSGGAAIATARLSPRGAGLCHFNRLAVRKPWRGRGAGRVLMNTLLDEARRRSMREVVLHAQIGAIAFYQQFGFAVEGEAFMEAGIAHRAMRLSLLAPA